MKRTVRMGLWLGLLGVLVASDGWGASAWLNGYVFRRMLTVTNLPAITADQANVPVLVKLTSANFSFENANANGYDVRFTAADGTTLLSYERERHSVATAQAEYWVKLPGVSSTVQTNFYVYYTPATQADGANPTNVWDEHYQVVYHMNQASGSATILDSTANARTGTPQSATLGATGLIDGAASGTSPGLRTELQSMIPRPGQATYELLFKAGAYNRSLAYVRKDGVSAGYTFTLDVDGHLVSWITDGNYANTCSNASVIALDQWYYVADIWGDAAPQRKIYVDGALDGSTNNGPNNVLYPYLAYFSGASCAQSLPFTFNGTLDELRFSDVPRSAAWLKTQNASMRDQLLSCGAEESRPEWLAEYHYRRMLVVTNTASILSTLTNVPILVKLSAANFNFAKANADGHDLRFTAADGTTLLSYERERHSKATAQAEYWVKLPLLRAGVANVFHMYYTPQVLADGANPTNVWDANYVFVYHMKETSGTVLDSTSNTRTGTPSGAFTLGASGLIDGAATGATLSICSTPAVAEPGTATFEALFKNSSSGAWKVFVFKKTGTSEGYILSVNSSSNLVSWMHTGGATPTLTSSNTSAPNTWHYVADIWGDAAPARKLYVDGVLDGSLNDSGTPYALWFVDQYLPYNYSGMVDEMRMSNVARSMAWLKAQNASMRDQLLSYGAEVAKLSGSAFIIR